MIYTERSDTYQIGELISALKVEVSRLLDILAPRVHSGVQLAQEAKPDDDQ